MKGFSDAGGLAFQPVADLFAPVADPPAARVPTAEAAALAALFRSAGADALDDRDLLALLLGIVMLGRPLGDLPERALATFGSFAGLLAAGERELRAVPGFGTHSVAALRLMHNAAVRLARAGLMRRRLLDEPEALEAYLAMILSRERIEQFRILFLDASGGLIADEAQARGTVNHTPVYPREVVRRAVELDAGAIVLVHNHPSGDPEPSRDDLEMTAEIEAACGLFGVAVRDHLIVGNGRSFSFRGGGLLRN